jgi:fibronectin-binding autotransporter adhesin
MPSTNTWTGGSGDWGLGSNWSNGSPPGTLDEALFNSAIVADLSNADYENIASLSMATGAATLDVEGEVTIGGAHLNGVANFIDTSQGTLLIDGGGVIAGQFVTSAIGTVKLSAGGTYQWNGQGSTQTIDMGTSPNDTLQFSTAFGGSVTDFNAGDIISYSGAIDSVVIGNNGVTSTVPNGPSYSIHFTGGVYNASNMVVYGNVVEATGYVDAWIAGNGNWSNPAGWSNGLPTSGTQVTIGALANALVTLASSATVTGLTVNATDKLAISSGAILTMTGASSIAGGASLILAGGATFAAGADIGGGVSGAGTLALTGGAFTLEAGAAVSVANWSMAGAGTTVSLAGARGYAGAFSVSTGATLGLAGGNLNLTGSATFAGATVNGSYGLNTTGTGTAVSGLTIGGTVTWTNAKTVTQTAGNVTIGDASFNSAAILNTSTGVWNVTDNSGIMLGSAVSSAFTNAGSFTKTGGAGFTTIATSFVDTGSVTSSVGTLAFAGPSNSFSGAIGGAGTVLFSGGATTLKVGATATVASLKESGAGTSVSLVENLTYANAFTQGAGSTFSVASGATLTLKGATTLGGATGGAGTLMLAGATTLAGGATLSISTLTIKGTGVVTTVNASNTYAGAFSQLSGATLTLSGGNLFLSGSATFTAATVNGSKALNTVGTGVKVANMTVGGTVIWSNSAAVTESGGNVTIGDSSGAAASLRNLSTGAWEFADDSGIGRGSSAASTMVDAGTLEKIGGSGVSTISASFTETTTGAIYADTGTLAFSGASNSFSGALGGAGGISFSGGASTLSSGATVDSFYLQESGAGTILNIAEDLTFSSAFSQGAGSTMNIASGDALALSGTTTLSGKVGGAGALELVDGDVATISSGATLSAAIWYMKGAGTATTLDGPLTYAGSFLEAADATLTLSSANLTLTGATQLDGATINGAGVFTTSGTGTTVADATIGGTVTWSNTKTVTENGGGVTIGDGGGAAAVIRDTATGIWNITDDSGIGIGSSTSSYFANAGLLEKTGGSATSVIASTVNNTGIIEVDAATLDFQGAVTAGGADKISANATLEFDSTVSTGQTVSFLGNSAELILGAPQGFAGRISGFDTGFTGDSLLISGPWTYAGFTENNGHTQGTLAFSNGSSQIGLTLLGNYASASFHAVVQSGGATLITYG